MAIDPRIPLMAVPPRRNLLADAGNLMQLKAAQTQMQREQSEYERQQARRNALSQAYDPQTGQIDFQRGMGALGQSGDVEGALALRGTQITHQTAEMDLIEKRARAASRVLGSIRSQEALDAAIPQMRALGFGEDAIAAAPKVYNEQTEPWFRAKEMEALDVADKLRIQLQAEGLAESKRAAGVSEARAAEKAALEARKEEREIREASPEGIAAKKEAEEKGKAISQAKTALPKIEGSAKEMKGIIHQIAKKDPKTGKWKTHPAFSGAVGAGWPEFITRRAGGTKYPGFFALIDQLKGKAFLQAFESLKGGGSITEREGQAAQQAMARLETSQSEADFLSALEDLEAALDRGVAAAQSIAKGKFEATTSPIVETPGSAPTPIVDWNNL